MRYELLVQSPEPGTPYDPAPLEALFSQRNVRTRPDGVRFWVLKNGEVEIGQLKEGGRLIGHELRIPLSGKTELVREAVVEGAALAEQVKAVLFDFQLSNVVTKNDEARVAEQFLRTARYAGEMMGVSEAIDAGFMPSAVTDAPAPSGTPLNGKTLLVAVAGLIGLYLLVESFLKRTF